MIDSNWKDFVSLAMTYCSKQNHKLQINGILFCSSFILQLNKN